MNSGNQLPDLDKILREDDESDFLPSAGSNLAAIFGMQVKTLDSSSSKQQVSKKPNISRNITQVIQIKPEVIIAKAVHAFKLQNGVYISIGKLGMALTGNAATKVYQIILYKNKQEHVSTVTVTHDFLYVIQPNNYSSYYDSNKENWSILFENSDVCIEFAREIALARYFSKNARIENVLYQDLSPVNKDVTAKEGDSVSIKYFISAEIIQPLKSNLIMYQTMTVEISTDDNWEKTLLGSSNGLKRILFLPPNKQISLGPGFPKDKDVILEIEIIDIQSQQEATNLHKVTSGKASIISRMAKMGQSMFVPKIPTSTTTDSEDTEDDVPRRSLHQRKAELSEGEFQKKRFTQESKEEISKTAHKVLKSKSDASVTNAACKPFVTPTLAPQWSPTQRQPNFVTVDGQVYSLQPQIVTPTVSTVIDPGLNMLLSETRMTNAELRMGMSKIGDNVQKLLDKFHVLELQNATSPLKERADLAALKMLLTTTASQTEEKEKQSQTNITATDISTQLNEFKDRTSALEKELRESKEYIKTLEDQKESLTQTNETLSKSIKQLEISLNDANSALLTVRKDLEESRELKSKCEEQTSILENKMLKLSETASSMETKENDKQKEIKHIMNKIYHALMDKFVEESYSTNYVRTVIANTIKNTTLQVLHKNNEKSNREPESISAKIAESDDLKVDNTEFETSSSSKSSEPTEVAKTTKTHIFVLQNEPPPIPPIDTEDENDWLQ
ncbi:FK506-binding protein 15 isoform X1 [Osmia lignaria lignaria]|uniref:FK506-binding protein 15 isoform X1 n=2 Tax=Osmia lignaria lignaria TaxID=1437193 RepID=UPI00147958AD|nr:FK506-binding protein 15 isoform X1 [Osmia lignaria]